MDIKRLAAAGAVVAGSVVAGMAVGEALYQIDGTPSVEHQESEVAACAAKLGDMAVMGAVPAECERYKNLFAYNIQAGQNLLLPSKDLNQYVEIVKENPKKEGNLVIGMAVIGGFMGAVAVGMKSTEIKKIASTHSY